MLAYTASRPRVGARQSSPNALLFVICGHIVLLAVAMSAKMAFAPEAVDPPTTIYSVPIDKPPPPTPTQSRRQQPKVDNAVQPRTPQPTETPVAPEPQVPLSFGAALDPAPSAGTGTIPLPPLPPAPQPVGVSRDAQLLTAPSELRPPYPQSKLFAEEEATLKLRLTTDQSGGVAAVDPLGRADAVFLASARRYLLAHWRYKPAMKDGRAVASSIVISLRFELDA